MVVDPLTTAIGFVHVQVERALSPRLSVYVGPSLRLFDNPLDDEVEDFIGIGVEAGVRWFPGDGAPFGWWVGARGVAAALSTDDPSGSGTERAFGGYVSALGGYSWRATSRVVLSGGAGVQYIHYSVAGVGPVTFFPALHTAVGVAL